MDGPLVMKALLVVDIQRGVTKRNIYNSSLFFVKVNNAIARFRAAGELVVFIKHSNKMLPLGSFDWEIDDRVTKSESDLVVNKMHGNAFHGTSLKADCDKFGVTDVVVCGLVSHGCVKHTCLGAIANGFKTKLLYNGHSCWGKDAALVIEEVETSLRLAGVGIEGD